VAKQLRSTIKRSAAFSIRDLFPEQTWLGTPQGILDGLESHAEIRQEVMEAEDGVAFFGMAFDFKKSECLEHGFTITIGRMRRLISRI